MLSARLLVVGSCAVSAGVHAGLAPAHLAESRLVGLSFAAAAVALAVTAAALVRLPDAAWPRAAAAALFLGLLAAYPVVSGGDVAPLAVATKAVEVVGLLAVLGARGGATHRRAAAGVAFATFAASAVVAVGIGDGHAHGDVPGTPAHAHAAESD